jgi:transcriptional regulator with XRE-family HTH domain
MSRVTDLMLQLTAAIREEVGALPTGVMTLGEEIHRARKAGRLSLQEVADAAGLTKSHVWELEQGRSRNPTIGAVHVLSKALGVPFLRMAEAALKSREETLNSARVMAALEAVHTGQLRAEQPQSDTPHSAGGEG